MEDNLLGRTKEEIKAVLNAYNIKPKAFLEWEADLGLLVAVWKISGGFPHKEGKIYFVNYKDGRFGKPTLVAERPSTISSMCIYRNKVIDCGDYINIYNTLDDNIMAERLWKSNSLCMFKDKLYDGGDVGIFDTLTGETVVVRENSITALCEYDSFLYDGDDEGIIRRTRDNEQIASRGSPILSLISFEGGLYDCGAYGLYHTYSNEKIVEKNTSFEIRQSLAFNNELFYLHLSYLRSIKDDKVLYSLDHILSPPEHVSYILPVKKDIIKEIKKK